MTDIARLIDHSCLRPDATRKDIEQLCEEAKEYNFYSVCVHPSYTKIAGECLSGSTIHIASVIGFPLGMSLSKVKIYEAIEAVLSGADELDIVINIGEAKSHGWDSVEKEITDIITATHGAVHKIIIEACYLTDNEKKSACRAVMNAGAQFIKTSTGFGPSGALIKDVKLIKSLTRGKVGIKAAGGIRTLQEVKEYMKAGATRIGSSSGVKIMKEAALKEKSR